MLRALRCSSDEQVFALAVLQLREKFLSRGYPDRVFGQASDSVLFEHREQHLVSRPKLQLAPETTIFSATHHPALDSTSIWNIIMDEETPFHPMVVRARPKSHGDQLVRAKTRTTPTIPAAPAPAPTHITNSSRQDFQRASATYTITSFCNNISSSSSRTNYHQSTSSSIMFILIHN